MKGSGSSFFFSAKKKEPNPSADGPGRAFSTNRVLLRQGSGAEKPMPEYSSGNGGFIRAVI